MGQIWVIKQVGVILGCVLTTLLAIHFVEASAVSLLHTDGHKWIWPLDDPPGKQLAIVGWYRNGGFGGAIATGDVNGDNFEDLIIGARFVPGQTFAGGETYVLPGPFAFEQTVTVPERTALIFQGTGDSQPQLGTYVDAGDLNGDGYDDIVIGSWTVHTSYVYLGSPSITATLPLTIVAIPETMALTVRGTDSGLIICNLNGDVYDDLFVETRYQVYGILGRPSLSMTHPVTIDVQTDPVDLVITGFQPEGWIVPAGENLGCGDVDGDGYDDLVVGAFGESPGGRDTAGSVYVIRGSSQITTGYSGTVQIPTQADAIIEGVDGGYGEFGDKLGYSLAVADVNGDGRADLILGAPSGDGVQNLMYRIGEVYLWLGRELFGQTVDLSTEAEWMLYGDDWGVGFGSAIDAGDFDNDGRSEIVFGCTSCGAQHTHPWNSGRGYVIDAEHVQGTHCITAVASLEVSSSVDVPHIGAVVGAVDLDADGYDDVILTTPSNGLVQQQLPGTVIAISYPLRHWTFLPHILKH